jgi:hypothetical protein
MAKNLPDDNNLTYEKLQHNREKMWALINDLDGNPNLESINYNNQGTFVGTDKNHYRIDC